MNSLEKEV